MQNSFKLELLHLCASLVWVFATLLAHAAYSVHTRSFPNTHFLMYVSPQATNSGQNMWSVAHEVLL